MQVYASFRREVCIKFLIAHILHHNLMDPIITKCNIFRDKLAEQGVCIRVIGNLSLLSEDMRKLIAEAMIITENNKKATLNLAFAYTCKIII